MRGIDVILKLMSEASGVEATDIMSDGRLKNSVICRYIIFYFLYRELEWSTPKIGRVFHRSHCTVLHGLNEAQNYISLPSYDKEREWYNNFIELVMLNENEG